MAAMVADVEDFDAETDLPRFLKSVHEKAEYVCQGNVEKMSSCQRPHTYYFTTSCSVEQCKTSKRLHDALVYISCYSCISRREGKSISYSTEQQVVKYTLLDI